MLDAIDNLFQPTIFLMSYECIIMPCVLCTFGMQRIGTNSCSSLPATGLAKVTNSTSANQRSSTLDTTSNVRYLLKPCFRPFSRTWTDMKIVDSETVVILKITKHSLYCHTSTEIFSCGDHSICSVEIVLKMLHVFPKNSLSFATTQQIFRLQPAAKTLLPLYTYGLIST